MVVNDEINRVQTKSKSCTGKEGTCRIALGRVLEEDEKYELLRRHPSRHEIGVVLREASHQNFRVISTSALLSLLSQFSQSYMCTEDEIRVQLWVYARNIVVGSSGLMTHCNFHTISQSSATAIKRGKLLLSTELHENFLKHSSSSKVQREDKIENIEAGQPKCKFSCRRKEKKSARVHPHLCLLLVTTLQQIQLI